MNEIKVTQSNTGTYTVNFECSNGEELSKTNARLLFEESAISEVIDDLNMHRGDHALLVRIAELEAERDRMREALAEAVEKYGKPGGPWNIPGESGSWIAKAREALEGAEK